MTTTRRIASRFLSRIQLPTKPPLAPLGQHLSYHTASVISQHERTNGDYFSHPLSCRFALKSETPSSLDRTTRGMAIKRKRKQRVVNEEPDNNLLMNENLVKELMANSKGSSPKDVIIRLVIEQDTTTPTTSEEISLADAIQKSLDLGLDLVEVNLRDAKLPVVRAVDYDAKIYRANKEKSKKKTDPGAVVKAFRVKARTADHDFQRKVNSIAEALQKGHKCKVQATCPRRVVLSTNPEGALEVIQRVMEEVSALGDATKPPEINPEKTNATVLLLPIKKK